MKNRLKKLYEMFLSNGDLLELFPELDHCGKLDNSGNPDEKNSWVRDREEFLRLQAAMESPAINLDFEQDPDEYIY